MKIGKISENALKRSVFKQLHINRDDVLVKAGVGIDASVLKVEPDEVLVLSSDPVIWSGDGDGKRVVHGTCNDLACVGAKPVGLLLTALLPPEIQEQDMRKMVQLIAAECEPMGVQILGGHTEITKAVNQPVISVTGVGKARENALLTPGGMKPGDEIVVTKWIALEGTSRVAAAKLDELSERYPRYMMEEAAGFDAYMSVLPEAEVAMQHGVTAMHDISEGGVFGALWELAEASGTGMEIDLQKIPLRQETVEICDFYGLNPYQMVSGGSMLLAAEDGSLLVRALQDAGIPATVVGRAIAGNDRVILNEDEKRYMDLPQVDEIHKIL